MTSVAKYKCTGHNAHTIVKPHWGGGGGGNICGYIPYLGAPYCAKLCPLLPKLIILLPVVGFACIVDK